MSKPTFTALAMTRNEGPFLLEWICWYRMLGFDVTIMTNDCTDHSPQLLEALARAGWVRHLPYHADPTLPPKKTGYRALAKDKTFQKSDWALICDVDEFLVPKAAGSVQELVADFPEDTAGIAFPWRIFGNGGWEEYHFGLVHQQFRRAARPGHPSARWIKSLFRSPSRYGRMSDHSPAKPKGGWEAPDMIWRDASGARLPEFNQPGKHPLRLVDEACEEPRAEMHHYIIRSLEGFEHKRGTPCASAGRDRYNALFLARYNQNSDRCLTAYRFEDQFKPIFWAAKALPDVLRLHHLCCADYTAALVRHAGKDPQDDARYLHHLRKAEEAP